MKQLVSLALLCLLLLCLLSASVFASNNNVNNKKVRFDGHKLMRIIINTEKQRGAIEAMGLDVWSHESQLIKGENHVVVPPGSEKLLEAFGVSIIEVMIEDVQKLIDEHDNQRASLSIEELKDDFFKAFHDFEEIVYETKRLASEHDDVVTYIPSIGKTIQGRDIMALYIHGGPSANKNSNHKRGAFDIPADVPKIVFTGGQHAREWIGPATVMYVLNELLTQYGTDTEVTNILNKIGIVIVPVSNPDGYDFSWTNNRLWRKNRRQISGSTYGVDLNRNWDSHWGGTGSSHSPSSDTYCGSKAFSEPETQALSQFISGLGNVIAAIDWHSYSQLILRPWGWTSSPAPGNTLLTQLGTQMKREIKAVHGKDYTNQASWELYYTTGSADDWFLDKMNITLSYTIELRDTGRYGFVLPASEIIPTGQESWAAAKMFIKVAIEELVGKLNKH